MPSTSSTSGRQRQLSLFTLGSPRVELGGQEISDWASRKAEALLIYLALTGRSHEREALATLFWDDRTSARALGNLSVLLSSLRKNIGDYLVADRQTVGLDWDRPIWVDALALGRGLALPAVDPPSRRDLARLEGAIALYEGDFLAGFSLRGASGFEEWSLFERERLRRLVVEALAALVDGYSARGRLRPAIVQARRLLDLDPLRESAHRQLMRLLARVGQRSAALAQFDRCYEILQRELGVEPDERTHALYEAIAAGRGPALAEASMAGREPTVKHNLPQVATSFVGRTAELNQIRTRLDNPACRLLTLLGQGGVGKTRLALQAGRELAAAFLDGVWFVPLATLSDPAEMVGAMAEALHMSFRGHSDPAAELLDYLRGRELLLILDNFEHLLAPASLDVLVAILREAPGVEMLATSRERLNLQAEWLLEIEGLPFPQEEGEEGDFHYGAVELFWQRAERLWGGRPPAPQDRASAAAISRLVQGLPLALELAASGVRVLSVAEIAAEIERSLDVLSVSARDLPGRHRSMRAVFAHSWRLLDAAEQRAFAALAVFRGGFTAGAAHRVTGVSGSILQALLDKSLIRKSEEDRFFMHPLVGQFAAEKLGERPDLQASISAGHARYYAVRCQQNERAFYGDEDRLALADMVRERENIHRAWLWATQQADPGLLEQFIESLLYFFDIRARYAEGLQWMDEAIGALRGLSDPADAGAQRRTLGRLLALSAGFHFRLGNFAACQEAAQEALALLLPAGPSLAVGHAYLFLGIGLYGLGQREEGLQYQLTACDAYRAVGHTWGVSAALGNAATIRFELDQSPQAIEYGLEALRLAEETGSRYVISGALQSLATIMAALGRSEEARRYSERGLQIIEEMERPYLLSAISAVLGDLAQQRGELAEAEQHLERALSISRDTGNRLDAAAALIHLGCLYAEQGKNEVAHHALDEAMAMAQATGSRHLLFDAISAAGECAALAGAQERAAALLAFVAEWGEGSADRRQQAGVRWAALRAAMPAPALDAWTAHGRALSLDRALAAARDRAWPSLQQPPEV